jgi:peptidoglycan/xylan/chitin deacetylase (PgdA/CDA1 family)
MVRHAPRTIGFSLRQALRDRVERELGKLGAGLALAQPEALRSVTVLMYHSVTDGELGTYVDPANAVSRDTFEWQMRYLAQHRQVVSMDELLALLAQGETPKPGTAVITFDDGYRDVLLNAAPILTKYELPATVFLATGYVGRGENQWIDELYTLFSRRRRDQLVVDGRSWTLSTPSERDKVYHQLGRRLIVSSLAERGELLEHLARQLDPESTAPRLTLTWGEVRELRRVAPTIAIGAHTRDHLDLTTLDPAQAKDEIEDAIDSIEHHLGETPRHMSYPYGRWNEDVRQSVIDTGLQSCCAASPTDRVHPDSDPFSLARFEAPAEPGLFQFRTSGAYPEFSERFLGGS